MLTYDEGGSWYDHVAPPQVDVYGDGFRVPALLVSPFARQGYIDHTQLDHTSSLKFIEDNWGVAPLTRRDAGANDFLSAFDFSVSAREPAFIPFTNVAVNPAPQPSPRAIYLSYGSGLAFAVVMITFAALREPRRKRKAAKDLQEESSE